MLVDTYVAFERRNKSVRYDPELITLQEFTTGRINLLGLSVEVMIEEIVQQTLSHALFNYLKDSYLGEVTQNTSFKLKRLGNMHTFM